MSKPIRVGFVELSDSKVAWAYNAHLPYLRSSPHYEITAIANSSSSLQSAEAAIAGLGLPDSTKAYASAEDLAADPEVDLIVTCTPVPLHHRLIKPALAAGKNIFVEWPLTSSLADAEELLALEKEMGAKSVVGLQGLNEPLVGTVKSIIESGRIGDVLSTSANVTTFYFGTDDGERTRSLVNVEDGWNVVTIHLVHWIDLFNLTLPSKLATFQTLLTNQRPTLKINAPAEGKPPTTPKTSHDHIFLQGLLETGAAVNISMRGGKTLDGTAIRWSIYGSEGEIVITSKTPLGILQISPEDVEVKVYDTKSKEVEVVPVEGVTGEIGGVEGLKGPARNVARLYEAYRLGQREKYIGLEEAVGWQRFIEKAYASSEARGEESFPSF